MVDNNEKKQYLAFDFGASSGRLVAGVYEISCKEKNIKPKLSLQELTRIEYQAERNDDGQLLWPIDHIIGWMKNSLIKLRDSSLPYTSIGIDTWGVDYVLLDSKGKRIGGAICYRDERTKGIYHTIEQTIPQLELYQRTGSQFMEPNTLCQLIAAQRDQPKELEKAKELLLMPSYLASLLCGVKANEATIASTSQLFSIKNSQWEESLMTEFGLSSKLFNKLLPAGSMLSPTLNSDMQKDLLIHVV